ncbi:MAG: GNAT family N-acetyltransferase [Lachnospiraceae bacterium]|nr:GNAT family N-acetyltransferase [Lachnospiraceae bacterium]
MEFRLIKPEDNAALAVLIRANLKARGLDIPGTVYFDSILDHLSDYYLADPERQAYYVQVDDEGRVVGGIGLAPFEGFENCAELQKLYLDDSVKGHGYGYDLIRLVEEKARGLGYSRMYLETHENLQAAIHIYERSGYRLIDKPDCVVHSAMTHFYLKELQ